MLVSLLILVIVIGLLIYLVQMLPLPPPWGQVATVLLVLIAVIWLLQDFPLSHTGCGRLFC